ncbi:hypothetical protein T440DRAFT_297009 [Plenodomus tracheiphilus IPT5]|uniref:Uncharacterized protein n=1 Tax=Plenodomus tracheiphilus IPT5 TaxID=1408161 RepID=A0A6A7AS24_9PLEO|nr:hypothetical protein T440DRAFT_297009 [Plenodomus tracheiphilus IPT5]
MLEKYLSRRSIFPDQPWSIARILLYAAFEYRIRGLPKSPCPRWKLFTVYTSSAVLRGLLVLSRPNHDVFAADFLAKPRRDSNPSHQTTIAIAICCCVQDNWIRSLLKIIGGPAEVKAWPAPSARCRVFCGRLDVVVDMLCPVTAQRRLHFSSELLRAPLQPASCATDLHVSKCTVCKETRLQSTPTASRNSIRSRAATRTAHVSRTVSTRTRQLPLPRSSWEGGIRD